MSQVWACGRVQKTSLQGYEAGFCLARLRSCPPSLWHQLYWPDAHARYYYSCRLSALHHLVGSLLRSKSGSERILRRGWVYGVADGWAERHGDSVFINSFVFYPSAALGDSLKIGLSLVAFALLMTPVVIKIFIPVYARLRVGDSVRVSGKTL